MNTGHILLAASAGQILKDLRPTLEFEGHRVAEAATGAQTVLEACSGRHDVLLLDSRLEGIGSYGLCRAIRPKSDLGIIVMDCESTGHSPIDLLNAGADDYVPAPFLAAELLARVRAILRRVARPGAKQRQIVLRDRVIDLESHEIRGPRRQVSHLTPKEFLVLECLVTHANKPRTHQSLAQIVWQRDGIGDVEYVRFVIKQLRRKLEPEPAIPQYILTERSVGYRFQLPAAAQDAVGNSYSPAMANR